jgi:L-rhamnose mutarotase
MHRICFTMRVHPSHLAHYERLHREAWPELLRALHGAGWRNYSLFLRDDGCLVGYLESADWPAAQAAMDAEEVSARWSVEMDRLVVPGTEMRWLEFVAATGADTPDPGASRAVAVGGMPADPGVPGARTALFREPDGRHVVYAEMPAGSPVDALALAMRALPGAEPGTFRRVFDLETQLAALGEPSRP